MTTVAAPYHTRKRYCLDRWAAATSSYDRLLSVSDDDSMFDCAVRGIPYVTFVEPVSHRVGDKVIYGPHFNAAWWAILEEADDYILALDTDVIPSGDILRVMEENYTHGFLCHGVPWREGYGRDGYAYETSCTFAAKADWRAALEQCEKERNHYDEPRNLYGMVRDMPHTDVLLMELEHLDGDGVTPKT